MTGERNATLVTDPNVTVQFRSLFRHNAVKDVKEVFTSNICQ